MNRKLYNMLLSEAVAEKEKAFLSLDLLGNKAAGVGDHSTGDFYKSATETLEMLVDADDKINTLEKYFKDKEVIKG